jgi:hypothetical protein
MKFISKKKFILKKKQKPQKIQESNEIERNTINNCTQFEKYLNRNLVISNQLLPKDNYLILLLNTVIKALYAKALRMKII